MFVSLLRRFSWPLQPLRLCCREFKSGSSPFFVLLLCSFVLPSSVASPGQIRIASPSFPSFVSNKAVNLVGYSVGIGGTGAILDKLVATEVSFFVFPALCDFLSRWSVPPCLPFAKRASFTVLLPCSTRLTPALAAQPVLRCSRCAARHAAVHHLLQ